MDAGCYKDMLAEGIYRRLRFADVLCAVRCENLEVFVMKKIMCALLFLLVLLWHCNPASAAKGRSKGKGGSSSARFSRTKGKNTAARSDRYTRPNKTQPEKASPRQKAVRVEKPGAQDKKDPPAQAKSAQEEKPAKGKGKQEVKSQKKIEKAATENAEEKGKTKGKFHKQQQTALQKQLQHEAQKHLKRAARLERMRVLALKQGDAKKVARIEKLMAREQQRYGKKSQRMLDRESEVGK